MPGDFRSNIIIPTNEVATVRCRVSNDLSRILPRVDRHSEESCPAASTSSRYKKPASAPDRLVGQDYCFLSFSLDPARRIVQMKLSITAAALSLFASSAIAHRPNCKDEPQHPRKYEHSLSQKPRHRYYGRHGWDLKHFASLVAFGDSYTDDSRLGYFINNDGKAPPVGYENPAVSHPLRSRMDIKEAKTKLT